MAAEKVGTFKIYIGNLPEGTLSDEVRPMFEAFGTVVECYLQKNRGFVHMEDDIEGKQAVEQLQGTTLIGQQLIIEESSKPSSARIPAVKLFVKNVSSSIDARGLRNMFKKFGCVLEVELGDGEGHVLLEAMGDIKSAIKEMNGRKIDGLAMSVEPGPVLQPEPNQEYTPSPKKMFKPTSFRSGGDWKNSWSSHNHIPSNPFQSDESHEEFYEDNFEFDDDGYNQQPSNPFELPPPSPFGYQESQPCFDSPPERILRDPQAHRSRNSGFGRLPGGSVPRLRGPPVPLIKRPWPCDPPPSNPWLAQQPRGRGRGMRGRGMGMVRPRMTWGGPSNQPNPFSCEDRVPRDGFPVRRQQNEYHEEEVFYEDEPLPAPVPLMRMPISGANAIPIGGNGGEELVARDPIPERPSVRIPRRGNGRRGVGRGRGRPQRFTALTDEISPGEKYPVPPMQNPSFRAPMKWAKEEVKRKVKRKKQPLVPAELPDYSTPVPELPRSFVPRGAVLKPFPPPMSQQSSGISQVEFTLSNSAGPSRYFHPQQNNSTNAQMDFTSDETV